MEKITLKDGRVFENSTIKKKGENMVSIIHSSGILSVPMKDLPDDVSIQLGYSHEEATKKEEAQLRQIEREKVEQAKSVSFKGLRLRMKLIDLPQFFQTTLWSFSSSLLELQTLDPKQYAISLRKLDQNINLSGVSWDEADARKKGLTKEQQRDFYEIGCEGVGDNATSYRWDHVAATFHKGLLAEFQVKGESNSADELQTKTISWLTLAERGLRERYGIPTEVIIPVHKFSILDTEAGYAKYLVRWKIEEQTITLGVSTNDSKFRPVIIFSDLPLMSELNISGAPIPKL